MMREKVGLLTKDGDMEPFYVCEFLHISSVPVDLSKRSTKFSCLCKIYTYISTI
jgi:hypothetical protein